MGLDNVVSGLPRDHKPLHKGLMAGNKEKSTVRLEAGTVDS